MRLAGPDAYRVADALFRPHRAGPPSALPAGRVVVGEVRDGDEVVDEALLLTFRAPHSYTAQDAVEIQTHGGPAVLRRVLALCLDGGARLAKPGEFTLRAYLSGRLDLAQAESVLDLVNAQSDTARRNAAQGLTRVLSRELDEIQTRLTEVLGNLQAVIDYPEEGVEERDKEVPLREALGRIDGLLATARAGELSRRGARLALVGRPNAGKSSLLNALLGYRRSLVSEVAGTTRDYLEAPLQLGGLPVTAIDTAGLRATPDRLEAEGVASAREVAAAADLVVLLIDASRPLDDEDRALVASLAPDRFLVVASKADLGRRWGDGDLGAPALPLSAVTGEGLGALRERVGALLVGEAGGSEVWIGNERHAEALARARAHVVRALAAPDDLGALDVEEALRALAEITGRGAVAEETLAHIFAQFCVGK